MTLNSISHPMLAGWERVLRITDGKLREKGKLKFKVARSRARKILRVRIHKSPAISYKL